MPATATPVDKRHITVSITASQLRRLRHLAKAMPDHNFNDPNRPVGEVIEILLWLLDCALRRPDSPLREPFDTLLSPEAMDEASRFVSLRDLTPTSTPTRH